MCQDQCCIGWADLGIPFGSESGFKRPVLAVKELFDGRIDLRYSIRIMDKKLTLRLDGAVIDRAKEYAELNHDSVSGLVERFLKTLTDSRKVREIRNSSVVAELSGVIAIPEGYDEREDYRLSKVSRYNG